jgi:dephospho-CoA kinase
MLRVGLTGGIGAGKSMVAGRLAEHGATLIDADRIAREVVAPGTDGLAEVVAAFGTDVLAGDGSLDRPALAAVVFADDTARARLNSVVHPRIGARTAELLRAAADDAVVVHDVPLLVENGLAPNYHLVLVVDAPVEQRVRRLVRDRGMSEQDVLARIASQADEAARRAAADVWLDNGDTPDQVLAEVDALWADRLVPFEANIRLGRTPGRGEPHPVPYDPTWPAQAARIMARLRAAAGDLAREVEHIGPTAVPGCTAENVIDVRIGVAGPDDVAALVEPLARAGFPATVEGPASAASADPARWADVYVEEMDV